MLAGKLVARRQIELIEIEEPQRWGIDIVESTLVFQPASCRWTAGLMTTPTHYNLSALSLAFHR